MKLLFVIFLFPVSVFAEQAPKHTCRILFLDGPDNAPEKLQLFDGEKCREVELPRMNFSEVYTLPPGPLNLRLLSVAQTDPAKIPAGAPSAVVAEGIADFYLLVTSDPANAAIPVRMQIINAGNDKLKVGQMMWFNLTKNTVGGIVGSEKPTFPPDCRLVLNPPAIGSQDYPVVLTFRIPDDPHLYPLCETMWHHDPRSRSVVFIMSEPGSRSPRVMVFPDYREAPKGKP